jgi:hypothetical protein
MEILESEDAILFRGEAMEVENDHGPKKRGFHVFELGKCSIPTLNIPVHLCSRESPDRAVFGEPQKGNEL